MSVILVATDFSDIADKAVNYACRLAEDQGAGVIVMHSFMVPVTFSDTPMPVIPISEVQHDAQEKMDQLVLKLSIFFPKIEIKGKIIYGDLINSLEEYSEEEVNPWLIVIANDSAGESIVWFSDTVVSAFRSLEYPVLAVPPDTVYRPVRKICFAYDHTLATHNISLEQLADVTKQLKAELHVVNISGYSPVDNEHTGNEEIQRMLVDVHPEYHFFYNVNVDDALQEFVAEHKMDWLLVVPHKHTFLERLFHKSHTRALVHTSHIPIVALHDS